MKHFVVMLASDRAAVPLVYHKETIEEVYKALIDEALCEGLTGSDNRWEIYELVETVTVEGSWKVERVVENEV